MNGVRSALPGIRGTKMILQIGAIGASWWTMTTSSILSYEKTMTLDDIGWYAITWIWYKWYNLLLPFNGSFLVILLTLSHSPVFKKSSRRPGRHLKKCRPFRSTPASSCAGCSSCWLFGQDMGEFPSGMVLPKNSGFICPEKKDFQSWDGRVRYHLCLITDKEQGIMWPSCRMVWEVSKPCE